MTYGRCGKQERTAAGEYIRPRHGHHTWVGLTAALLTLCAVPIAQPQESAREAEQILQAQRILSTLGYDAGQADGVMGPLTRQAIETFQRAFNLAPTGALDPPTLVALGMQPPSRIPFAPPRTVSTTPQAPWRVVLTYLRYYDTNPARLLPYVTDAFRQGRPPREWLASTKAALDEQQFYRLSWHIEQVETDATSPPEQHATVYVQSRVRIRGQEATRREVFSLVQRDASAWLIDGWQSQPLSTAESTTDATPVAR